MDYIVLIILLIIFVSCLIRSTFGFGDALIAMPLLALLIDIRTASPVVAFMGLTISIGILAEEWRNLEFRRIRHLILFSVLGIPIGLLYLKGVHESIIKISLGIVLILFSVYKLSDWKKLPVLNKKWSVFFGVISGILGGAYNTNGPPIIIWGTIRRWKPSEFRLMLQGIFLPTNLFIVCGHGIAGLWTADVIKYFLFSLPLIITAVLIGRKLNKLLSYERFTKYIFLFLIITGSVLIIDSL